MSIRNVANWFFTKYRAQAAVSGVQQTARNMRK